MTSTVADKGKEKEEVFKLKLKGTQPAISEAAKENVLKQAGKVDSAGNIVVEDKPKPDPIEKSLALRVKSGGNLQGVVKEDKKDEEVVFKLRMKGDKPVLKEAPRDPTNVGVAEAQANPVPEKEVKAPPCEIEKSLQSRLQAGSYTSTI